MNAEPSGQYQLLVLHAGGKRKVVLAQLICALIMQFGLTAITVLYPAVTGMFGRLPSAGEWIMAWAGHLALSLLGLSLSVFFQKSYIPMLSRSMPPFIVVLLLSLVQGSLSGRLPESIQWLVKILPPAFYPVREMMLYEQSKLGAVILTEVWAILYAIVLLIIHIWISGRRDLRS